MEKNKEARLERELKGVDELIEEAEERRRRGDPNAILELNRLRSQRAQTSNAIPAAKDEDYLYKRNRQREQRSFIKKVSDTLSCEM